MAADFQSELENEAKLFLLPMWIVIRRLSAYQASFAKSPGATEKYLIPKSLRGRRRVRICEPRPATDTLPSNATDPIHKPSRSAFTPHCGFLSSCKW